MADPERRRRRLRQGQSAGNGGANEPAPEGRAASTADVHDPTTAPAGQRRAAGSGPATEDRESERGLRGLVGSGSSQVSVFAALRARDASRPSEADLAEAEKSLVVVRRNWVPREELPRNGR